jgi:hypothetical protein
MLCDAVAARGPGGVLPTPLLLLLWRRLRRMATRVTRAAARLAAGIPLRAPRPPPATPRPSRPQPLRLPQRYAWVVVEVPGTAAYGNYLQALLADPQMAPLAAIPSVRRMLNPLCQMLGIPKLPPLPKPPPLPPRPAAVAPRPAAPRSGAPEPASDKTLAGCHPPPPTPVAA